MSDEQPDLGLVDAAGLAPASAEDVERFHHGGAPTLAIAATSSVERFAFALALQNVEREEEPDGRGGTHLALLVSTAGDGRSTAALQIAVDRTRAGHDVYVRRRGTRWDPEALVAAWRDAAGPIMWIVDDAHEELDAVFATLRLADRELVDEAELDVVLCGERSAWGRWGGDLRPWSHVAVRVTRSSSAHSAPRGDDDAEAEFVESEPTCTFASVLRDVVKDEDAWRDLARGWLRDAEAGSHVDAERRLLVLLGTTGLLGIDAVPESLLEAADVADVEVRLEALAVRVPLRRVLDAAGAPCWSTRAPSCAGGIVDALVDDGADVLRPHLEALVDAALAAESTAIADGAEPSPWTARLARLAARLARPASDVRWILEDTGAEDLAVDLAARALAKASRVDLAADHVTALRRAGRASSAAQAAESAWASLRELAGFEDHARRFTSSWALSELRAHGADRGLATLLVALSDSVESGGRPVELERHTLEVALRTFAWIGQDDSLDLSDDLRERLERVAAFRAEVAPERHEFDEGTARIDVTRPEDVPFEPEEFTAWLEELDGTVRSERPAEAGTEPLAFKEATRQYRRHVASRVGPLVRALPREGTGDALQDAFEAQLDAAGIQPYEAQMEAYFSIFDSTSVFLNTPTGSGKSLVALAAHFAALGRGERSVYTAPTKALVNEKFFDLCRRFGSANVGLLTGDASVNRDAPILCCTAEILSSMAQVEGAEKPFGWVVMDEFHYFSDKERGVAWLLPLVLLEDTKFLLMSATIGDVLEAKALVDALTGQNFELVRSTERPVPLVFSYRVESERDAIQAMREESLMPGYVVCVTRAEASDKALAEPSSGGWSSKSAEVPEHVFTSPYGKKLKRALRAGIGLHHSGLLPKYRRLVETMSGANQLHLIFGTDTLGVGVNLPIRTVLFPQLIRNAGAQEYVRLDAARFQQLAGRAGRAGLVGAGGDPQGDVWVLAPEDEIERRKAAARAAAQAAKGKKQKKKKPAKKAGGKGVSWSEQTMEKLVESPARPLEVRFELSPGLVMNFVRRGSGGLARLRKLIADLPLKPAEREHFETRLAELLGTLTARREVREVAGDYEVGRRSARRETTKDDESGEPTFDRPLLRFLHDVVWDHVPLAFSGEAPNDASMLDVLSLVESVVDDPRVVLGRQAKKLRDEHWQAHKEAGTDAFDMTARRDFAEERQEIEHPQPLKDELEAAFERWDAEHPGLASKAPAPKSVARDMFELGMGFQEYVRHYRLQIFEGELLRYLSEVWRVLARGLPPSRSLERATADIREWLGALVRHVDSSLIDEWERLDDPDRAVDESADDVPLPFDVTRQPRAFERMVRNAAFRWVRALVDRRYEELATPGESGTQELERVDPEALAAKHAEYLSECHRIELGPDARGPELFDYDPDSGRVEQTLLDPDGYREWALVGVVDLEASREEGDAVIALRSLERKGFEFGGA